MSGGKKCTTLKQDKWKHDRNKMHIKLIHPVMLRYTLFTSLFNDWHICHIHFILKCNSILEWIEIVVKINKILSWHIVMYVILVWYLHYEVVHIAALDRYVGRKYSPQFFPLNSILCVFFADLVKLQNAFMLINYNFIVICRI